MRNEHGIPDPSLGPLDPIEELELSDFQVEAAGIEEDRTCFDPDVHPRDHRAGDPDEPTCDCEGHVVDVQDDTPSVDDLTLDVPDAGIEPILGDFLDPI